MKTVYKASNITEAQIVKGLLEASNIDAFVKGFYLQGGIGETAPTDFASVAVEDYQVEQALEIIAIYENNNVSNNSSLNETDSSDSSKSALNKKVLIISIIIIAFFIATLLSAQ